MRSADVESMKWHGNQLKSDEARTRQNDDRPKSDGDWTRWNCDRSGRWHRDAEHRRLAGARDVNASGHEGRTDRPCGSCATGVC